MSDILVLGLVLLLVASGYAAGRVHGQVGYRDGYRGGYRQGYADAGRYRPAPTGRTEAVVGEVQVGGSTARPPLPAAPVSPAEGPSESRHSRLIPAIALSVGRFRGSTAHNTGHRKG
ncbi:MAG TPA: hypothetical protein VH561_19210 [Micromonosporaceae bacterium]